MSEELPIEFIGAEEQTSEVTLADVLLELRALRKAVEAMTEATVMVAIAPSVA